MEVLSTINIWETGSDPVNVGSLQTGLSGYGSFGRKRNQACQTAAYPGKHKYHLRDYLYPGISKLMNHQQQISLLQQALILFYSLC